MSKKRTGAVADCPPLVVRHRLNRCIAVTWRSLVVHGTGGGIEQAQVSKVGTAGRVAGFPCGVRASKIEVSAPWLERSKISQHIAAGSTVYTT
jgi:hypothetical protein